MGAGPDSALLGSVCVESGSSGSLRGICEMVTTIRGRKRIPVQRVHRRVVITGMGVVSPVGNSVEQAWGNIAAGRSGIGQITSFAAGSLDVKIAGEVRGFDPLTYI